MRIAMPFAAKSVIILNARKIIHERGREVLSQNNLILFVACPSRILGGHATILVYPLRNSSGHATTAAYPSRNASGHATIAAYPPKNASGHATTAAYPPRNASGHATIESCPLRFLGGHAVTFLRELVANMLEGMRFL